jgi:hypothetical protein
MKHHLRDIVLPSFLATLSGILFADCICAQTASPHGVVQDKTQSFPTHFPAFSWDRVPIYQMFSDGERPLTDEEVGQISATCDFLCIEKNHAHKTFGGAEGGAKHEIARFKALKPETKCLFYFNSAYAFPFTTDSKVFRYGKVGDGFRSFLLEDPESGELAERGRVYYFDVLNPEFRSWWSETVGKYVRETGADGLFVDQMHGFAWLRGAKKREVAAGQAEMMRMAKAAIGSDKILLLNNAAENPELFKIGDAFMFENFKPDYLTKESILRNWGVIEKISHAGKISVWRIGVEVGEKPLADGVEKPRLTDAEYETLSKKRLPFHLAVFLIGAQPGSYFQYGWGWKLQTGPLAGYPEFSKPLGKPLGEYSRESPDSWVFRRDFEHASVWLDLDGREGKIDWKQE